VEIVAANIDVSEQNNARATLEQAFEEIKKLKGEIYGENLALREEIDHSSTFEENRRHVGGAAAGTLPNFESSTC
jgi:hypothetical protein